jgi:hypothetical protein
MARLRPPPTWTNQDVVLYHGTVETHADTILHAVLVGMGRERCDFGRGFYTTTNVKQARIWASQISLQRFAARPVVIWFEVSRDRLAALDILWFVRGQSDAADYWSLVIHCRGGGKGHSRLTNEGWYDVVAGPLAAVWQQRRTISHYDQVGFHTDRAAAVLNTSRKGVLA